MDDPGAIESFKPFSDSKITSNAENLLAQFTKLWLQREETNQFNHKQFITDDIDYNKLTKIEGKGYGINYDDFKQLVTYYGRTFKWEKYKKVIESFNHEIVNIRGIHIHFIRHRLNPTKLNTEETHKKSGSCHVNAWLAVFILGISSCFRFIYQ